MRLRIGGLTRFKEKIMSMTLKRTLTGVAVAAFTLGATAVITTGPASARGWGGGGWHGGWGGAGAGFATGLAVGALTSPYYYGYPGYGYYSYGYPGYAYNYGPSYPYNACSYNPWNCF
jgi:hypothetical protein